MHGGRGSIGGAEPRACGAGYGRRGGEHAGEGEGVRHRRAGGGVRGREGEGGAGGGGEGGDDGYAGGVQCEGAEEGGSAAQSDAGVWAVGFGSQFRGMSDVNDDGGVGMGMGVSVRLSSWVGFGPLAYALRA